MQVGDRGLKNWSRGFVSTAACKGFMLLFQGLSGFCLGNWGYRI